MQLRLGFIGFGHIATTLCQGILRSHLLPSSSIHFTRNDPKKAKRTQETFHITGATLETLCHTSDYLLLCVLPHLVPHVLEKIASFGPFTKMLGSVASGIPLSTYQSILGPKAQVARIMPNTPSSVGEGMTLFSFPSHASLEFRSNSHRLFSCMGKIADIPETSMDIGTGVSGSGPAFVLHLLDAMAKAALQGGIDEKTALEMAAQTFLGAAKMVLEGKLPQDLIAEIAVPGGTTQAGLAHMREHHMGRLLIETIQAAGKHAKNLSR